MLHSVPVRESGAGSPNGAARTRYHGGMSDIYEVIGFWFGAPESPERGRPRKCWFEKNGAFDAEVRSRFLGIYRRAAAGRLSRWERGPYSALALRVARRMADRGFDHLLRPVERWFVYLPFEHAEDLAAQRRSVALFGGLAGDPDSPGTIDYAHRHYDIIARFGRFPHRNAMLGRESTAEEKLFLSQPGSGF